MCGLGRYYELQVTCKGRVEPVSGYFINIKQIDQAVHRHVLPQFEQWLAGEPGGEGMAMGSAMRRLIELLGPPLDEQVQSVCLRLTPMHSLTIRSMDMDHVIIRQQYEFSAAHRLHAPQLGDEQNRRLFGKCNNPAGHGHNYRLDVAVRVPINSAGHLPGVEQLDQVVDEAVIAKLDHKFLNVDVEQFADLNPSVENMAKVIYQMLEPRIGELADAVELDSLSVWETQKTVCTYRGPAKADDAQEEVAPLRVAKT